MGVAVCCGHNQMLSTIYSKCAKCGVFSYSARFGDGGPLCPGCWRCRACGGAVSGSRCAKCAVVFDFNDPMKMAAACGVTLAPVSRRLVGRVDDEQLLCAACDDGSFRIGDWFQSVKGRKLWPVDPRPEDVDFEEVAHSLAHIGRFNGHVPGGVYSVAQHAVYVARCVAEPAPRGEGRPDLAIAGLHHDDAEYAIGDVIRPLKRSGALTDVWREAERAWDRCFASRLGFDPALFSHEVVKRADDRVLCGERDAFLAAPPDPWRDRDYPPYAIRDAIWSPAEARAAFIAEHERLLAARS